MEAIIGILTSKLFIINCVLGFALLEYALHCIKPLYKVKKELNDKYPGFKRCDLDKIKRINFIIMIPFILFRVVFAWSSIAFKWIGIKMVYLTKDPKEPKDRWTGWRYHAV